MSWFRKQAPESAENVKESAEEHGKAFAHDISQEAGKTADAIKHDLSSMKDKGKSDAEAAKGNANAWLNDAKARGENAANDARGQAEEARRRGQGAVEETKGSLKSWLGAAEDKADKYANDAKARLNEADSRAQSELERGRGKASSIFGQAEREGRELKEKGESKVQQAEDKAASWWNSTKSKAENADADARRRVQYEAQRGRDAAAGASASAQQYGQNFKDRADSTAQQTEDKASSWWGSAKSKAEHADEDAKRKAQQAEDKASSWWNSTKSKAEDTEQDVRDRAHRFAHDTEDRIHGAEHKAADWLNQHAAGKPGGQPLKPTNWSDHSASRPGEALQGRDVAGDVADRARHSGQEVKQEASSWWDRLTGKANSAADQAKTKVDSAADQAKQSHSSETADRVRSQADRDAQRARAAGEATAARLQEKLDGASSKSKDTLRSAESNFNAAADNVSQSATDAANRAKSGWSSLLRSADKTIDSANAQMKDLSSSLAQEWNQLTSNVQHAVGDVADRGRWLKGKLVGTAADAANDPFRVPYHDLVGSGYDAIFRYRPLLAHQLYISTPDILPPTVAARAGGWDLRPALSWQFRAAEANRMQSVVTRFALRGVQRTGGVQYKQTGSLDAQYVVPLAAPTEAWSLNLTAANSVIRTGSSIGLRSYIDATKATSTGLLRAGPRGPALTFGIDMDTKTQRYTAAVGLSQTVFRNAARSEDVTAGLHVISVPQHGQFKLNGKSPSDFVSQGSLALQYNGSPASGSSITADARLNLNPSNLTPKVGDCRVRLAYSEAVAVTSYPRWSVGVAAGAVSFNDNAGDEYGDDYSQQRQFFQPSTNTKSLGLVDMLYVPTPHVRYGARVASDGGLGLHYEQRYADGLLVRATVQNGKTGTFGNAANQQQIRPTLGVSITIGE